jgi:hypothetical protein
MKAENKLIVTFAILQIAVCLVLVFNLVQCKNRLSHLDSVVLTDVKADDSLKTLVGTNNEINTIENWRTRAMALARYAELDNKSSHYRTESEIHFVKEIECFCFLIGLFAIYTLFLTAWWFFKRRSQ